MGIARSIALFDALAIIERVRTVSLASNAEPCGDRYRPAQEPETRLEEA
jgi:hypothetical protein